MRTTRIMRQTLVALLIMATAGIARAGLIIEQVSNFGGGLGKPVRIAATANGWAVSYPRDDKVVIFDSAGSKVREITGLHGPLAVAFLAPDSLFVGEQNPARVSVWKTSDGTLVRSFGTTLSKPSDMIVTSTKVYVLDSGLRIIKVYDMSGNSLPDIGNSTKFTHPTGLTLNTRDNTLMVGELTTGLIHVYDLNGVWKRDIGGFGSMEDQFARIDGVGYSDLGMAMVADPFLSRIQAIEMNGNYRGTAGTFGTGTGQVKTPLDLVMGPGQTFAVADFGNARLDLFRLTFDAAADVLSVPDGVAVNVNGPVVIAGTQDFGSTIYVEPLNRANGIRIDNVSGTIARGAVVKVIGTTATSGGVRKINAASISTSGTAKIPTALGIRCNQLGGKSPVNTPSIGNAVGIYNVGLLVRVWGRVKSISGSDFYISDGSAQTTWIHAPGITPLPQVNSFVAITGICSAAFDTGGVLKPQILPRNASDIKGM